MNRFRLLALVAACAVATAVAASAAPGRVKIHVDVRVTNIPLNDVTISCGSFGAGGDSIGRHQLHRLFAGFFGQAGIARDHAGVAEEGERSGAFVRLQRLWRQFAVAAAPEVALRRVLSGGDVVKGAPLRLATPWKYGVKSTKGIQHFIFTDERPKTYWMALGPTEYGFWANVNPRVPHPRWSQSSEEILGTGERVPTQLYNGYGEQVAMLYSGMQNKRLFM